MATADRLVIESPTPASIPRFRYLRRIAIPILFAVLALLPCSALVDWNTVFVNGLSETLNDQVSYVTAARNWAATGSLDSNEIVPSLLAQHWKRNTPYMPAHYWALGEIYRNFGFSVPCTFFPELFSYVLSCLLIFFIADKLYGERTAIYSCALFAFFPLALIYAFTAMMELEVVAAALAAFAVFLILPERTRPWLGPLLLMLPVLFRETGVAIAAPMAIMIFFGPKLRWRQAAVFSILSAVVLLGTMKLPAAGGRPSLWGANVFYRGSHEALYKDAFAVLRLHPTASDWIVGLMRMFRGNLHELLIPHFASGVPTALDFLSMLFVLASIVVGLALWWRQRDRFALGVSALVALMILMEICFYKIWGYYGSRVMLMCAPFSAVVYVQYFDLMLKNKAKWALTVAAVLLAAVGLFVSCRTFQGEPAINAEAAENTRFLESINIDDQGLLASPYWISMDYVEKHYPVKWSHIPSNFETLRLLDQKYGVATLLLPVSGPIPIPERLQPSEVTAIGLQESGVATYQGIRYEIFRRTDARRQDSPANR